MKTVDIDIGGTFTDCFVSWDDQTVIKKEPTTAYDLSTGVQRSLRGAAAELGISYQEMLQQLEAFRYSTTVALNKLIERKGPKLGLITTEGFEDNIFIGRGSQWADGLTVREQRNMARMVRPLPLVSRELTVGIKERVDYTGQVIRPLKEEDVLEKVQYLVDQGGRGFVVSLVFSFLNPTHEQLIKQIIQQEYPDFYLGNMPIMLSSEVHPKRFEYTRSITTIINAYLHQSLAEEVAGIQDRLRSEGYGKQIFLVHSTGGMSESFRTAAVNTFNGGPVAGLMGGAHLGKDHGFGNVIVTDMGGTSFDLGMVVEGSARNYQFNPVLHRWLTDLPVLECESIGAGGGSIAWVNSSLNNRLEVGPMSAGSMPGPVAYDQGGTRPTVTDADVVLGYISPSNYHGGKMVLNREKAEQAILEQIADPLNLSVPEAALLIKEVIDAKMGHEIYRQTVLKGYDPSDFVLFAAGGAGPTHCCGYAAYAEVNRVITFPFSPVFCAFGSSTMDLVHLYEKSRHVIILAPGGSTRLQDFEQFNEIVKELVEKAYRDFRGEGFGEEDVRLSLELDMKYGGQLNVKRTSSPVLKLQNSEDIEILLDAFQKEYASTYSPLGVYPEGGVEVDNFIIRAFVPQAKFELPKYPLEGSDPGRAYKGQRSVHWTGIDPELTEVYDAQLLRHGNIIQGPALVEASHTTVVVSPGWSYRLNTHLTGILQREGGR